MISASKTTFSLNNLNILGPKLTKSLMNFRKKLCESPPRPTNETKAKKHILELIFQNII